MEDGRQTLTIYTIKGPSGVGIIRLFESPPEIPGFTIRIETLAQQDLMAARFISGEAAMMGDTDRVYIRKVQIRRLAVFIGAVRIGRDHFTEFGFLALSCYC